MHFIAVHAGHIKALCVASGVQHGIVSRAFGAKAEIVTHQHITRTQPIDQHIADECLG